MEQIRFYVLACIFFFFFFKYRCWIFLVKTQTKFFVGTVHLYLISLSKTKLDLTSEMRRQLPGIQRHFQTCECLTRNSLSPSKQQKPQTCSVIDKFLHEKKIIPYKEKGPQEQRTDVFKGIQHFCRVISFSQTFKY